MKSWSLLPGKIMVPTTSLAYSSKYSCNQAQVWLLAALLKPASHLTNKSVPRNITVDAGISQAVSGPLEAWVEVGTLPPRPLWAWMFAVVFTRKYFSVWMVTCHFGILVLNLKTMGWSRKISLLVKAPWLRLHCLLGHSVAARPLGSCPIDAASKAHLQTSPVFSYDSWCCLEV